LSDIEVRKVVDHGHSTLHYIVSYRGRRIDSSLKRKVALRRRRDFYAKACKAK
jgi:hypothetical protein